MGQRENERMKEDRADQEKAGGWERHGTQHAGEDTSADPHCQGRGESGTKGGCKRSPQAHLTASKQAHPMAASGHSTQMHAQTPEHAETYPDTHRNTHTDTQT